MIQTITTRINIPTSVFIAFALMAGIITAVYFDWYAILCIFICIVFFLTFNYLITKLNDSVKQEDTFACPGRPLGAEWLLYLSLLAGFCATKIAFWRFNHFENTFCTNPIIVNGVVSNKYYNPKKALPYTVELKTSKIIKNNTMFYVTKKIRICTLLKSYVKEGQKIQFYCTLEKIDDTAQKMSLIGSSLSGQLNTIGIQTKILKKNSNKKWRFSEKLTTKTAAFFHSIFFGNRAKFAPYCQESETFIFWGIAHMLARSGLHLMILFVIIKLLIQCMPIGYRLKKTILIFFIFLYCSASTAALPFLRALFAYSLHETTVFFNCLPHALHTLGCIACAVLLYNPMHLFFLEFQLSFGLTFALLLWSNKNKLAKEK